MADDESEPNFLKIYGAELLPKCECFSIEGEEIAEAGRVHMTNAVDLGESVFITLVNTGVCPSAMMQMVSLVVGSIVHDSISMQRSLAGLETQVLYRRAAANLREVSGYLEHHARRYESRAALEEKSNATQH